MSSGDQGQRKEPLSGEAPVRPALVERVVFVGLGLVGGSLAKATRAAFPSARILGVDRPAILDAAREHAIIDDGRALEDAHALIEGADLVVLSLPVLAITHALERLAPALHGGPVVTDTGSTKLVIDECAAKLGLSRFIGSHPMAGKAQGGLAHADAQLFHDATWFLCPGRDVDAAALQLLRSYVRALGARPVEIDAGEHDRAVALTSHVPHVVANALAELVLEDGVLEAAGGSLKDILRVAGAPIETWADTLETNEPAVRTALLAFAARIQELAQHLDDKERLRALFGRGRACRERVRGPGG